MQEVFEKIKERLEENKERYIKLQSAYCNPNKVYEFVGKEQAINIAIEIVNQVEEEYVRKTYKFGKYEQVNKHLDSLHSKILKSKFAEEVTEAELEHEAAQKLNDAQAYYKGYVQACEDYGKKIRQMVYSEVEQ